MSRFMHIRAKALSFVLISPEVCSKCVIIHNTTTHLCMLYVLRTFLNSVHVRLLYTLHSEENDVGPDSRQVP